MKSIMVLHGPVPTLLLLRQAIREYDIVILFLFATTFYQAVEGTLSSTDFYVTGGCLAFVCWCVQDGYHKEKALYLSIYQRLMRGRDTAQMDLAERLQTITECINTYLHVRHEQHAHLAAQRSYRLGDTLVYLMIIGYVGSILLQRLP